MKKKTEGPSLNKDELKGLSSSSAQRSARVRKKKQAHKKENKLLVIFLVISALAHILVFYVKPQINQIVIEREESVDIDLDNFVFDPADLPEKPQKVVAVKDQKVAPEATIPSNMLPQLAKKTKVEKKPKEDKPVEVPAEKEPKKEKPKDEKKVEKTKKEPVKEEKKPEEPKANILKEAELKKRLALEKLRNSDDIKKSKDLSVQSDLQNKVDEEAIKLKQEQLEIQREAAKAPCTKFIKQFVQPMIDEQLPVKYQFGKKMTVDFLITPAKDLSIKKIAMETTSEDDYFDKIVENAILASAPLPEPCAPFAGTQIRIRFSNLE